MNIASYCFSRMDGGDGSVVRENKFQKQLIKKIKEKFPECIVLKNDPNYIQGIPDIVVLGENHHWAMLECKRESEAHKQPNQEYYVEKANQMAFGRFVSPENEEEVLRDLQQAFGARG